MFSGLFGEELKVFGSTLEQICGQSGTDFPKVRNRNRKSSRNGATVQLQNDSNMTEREDESVKRYAAYIKAVFIGVFYLHRF